MPQGYSLHIGVNQFDRQYYGQNLSFLNAAVNDAVFWHQFAKDQGYHSSRLLKDEEAVADTILNYLKEKSAHLNAGDILLLTYSGHGGQIPNEKKRVSDDERNDQTWCLYDRELLDDELYECFREFAEGVRITVVSDSCHSGTVARDEDEADQVDLIAKLKKGLAMGMEARGRIARVISADIRYEIGRSGGERIIRPIQNKYLQSRKGQKVKAAVTLLAACQDEETTFDGEEFGLFTEALKELLTDTDPNSNAEELIAKTKEKYSFPKPNLFTYGAKISSYRTHSPFAIDIPEPTRVEGFEPARVKRDDSGTMHKVRPLFARLKLTAAADFEPKPDDQLRIVSERIVDGQKILEIEVVGTPIKEAEEAAHALQAALQADGKEIWVEVV